MLQDHILGHNERMDDELVYERTLEYVLSLSAETDHQAYDDDKDARNIVDAIKSTMKSTARHRKNNSFTFLSVKSGKSDESELFRVIKDHQVVVHCCLR